METEIAISAIGAVMGAVAGGLAGLLVSRQRPESADPLPPSITVDPQLDEQIHVAARRWVENRQLPDEAEGLIARKLRLGLALQARRRGRVS